jgi:hypothetical protein
MINAQPIKSAYKPNLDSLTLCIDFDGVIHDYKHPVDGRRMGPPIENAAQSIKMLRSHGFIIKVYSVKAATDNGRKAVEDWLRYYGIPFTEVTAIKPNAALYIDDRGLHFENWTQAYEAIGKRLKVNFHA